jgi:hypothetical protein
MFFGTPMRLNHSSLSEPIASLTQMLKCHGMEANSHAHRCSRRAVAEWTKLAGKRPEWARQDHSTNHAVEGTRTGAEGGCGCRAWGEEEWRCKGSSIASGRAASSRTEEWSLRGGCMKGLPPRIVKGALVTQELPSAKLQRSSRPVSSREGTGTDSFIILQYTLAGK